jgi:hypothetical protein
MGALATGTRLMNGAPRARERTSLSSSRSSWPGRRSEGRRSGSACPIRPNFFSSPPRKRGVQFFLLKKRWTPASAGVTKKRSSDRCRPMRGRRRRRSRSCPGARRECTRSSPASTILRRVAISPAAERASARWRRKICSRISTSPMTCASRRKARPAKPDAQAEWHHPDRLSRSQTLPN